jgi:NADPH-dependent ferric siderophore reductase
MARTNMAAARVAAQTPGLIHARVLRSVRLGHSFQRVTLGHGTLGEFVPLGFDQWFRLFLPSAAGSLERLPQKLDTLAYLKYLALPKGARPILRNYTVAEFRPAGLQGPELDVDFVLHSAPDGSLGPAARWARDALPGERVAFIDEGLGFNRPGHLERVFIVADETGLPAAAGVLAALPRHVTGTALLEVPDVADRRDVPAPAGLEVRWLPRTGTALPGTVALDALRDQQIPREPFYGWVVGESALASGARRHWVGAGVPKSHITFCGYWKNGARH